MGDIMEQSGLMNSGTRASAFASIANRYGYNDKKLKVKNQASMKASDELIEKIKINGDAIHLGETGYYQFASSMLGYAYDLFSVE